MRFSTSARIVDAECSLAPQSSSRTPAKLLAAGGAVDCQITREVQHAFTHNDTLSSPDFGCRPHVNPGTSTGSLEAFSWRDFPAGPSLVPAPRGLSTCPSAVH